MARESPPVVGWRVSRRRSQEALAWLCAVVAGSQDAAGETDLGLDQGWVKGQGQCGGRDAARSVAGHGAEAGGDR